MASISPPSIYLDHNASTPVEPAVLELATTILRDECGNPSSRHRWGRRLAERIDTAREQVAAFLNCSPDEILFTSGATESCNLAIKGVAGAYAERGRHIVTGMTEHKAVLEPCKQLARDGIQVHSIQPDRLGRITADQLASAVTGQTILAAFMLANNVTGTIHPVQEFGALCRQRGIVFFCDATGAAGKLPIDVEAQNLDLVAFSGHKLGAPGGTGVLYVRNRAPRVRLDPLISGGGQERNLRGGTEYTAGIAALGLACELARQRLADAGRIARLRDRFEAVVLERIPQAQRLGDPESRLNNTSLIAFDGVKADKLLGCLPEVALSAGSACDSAGGDSNHVLKAMGIEEDLARSAIRISLGHHTTSEELDYVADRICQTYHNLRGTHGI